MRCLDTTDSVIDWLGGPREAALWLGCTDNNICHWRHRGIPPGHHTRLIARAKREGVIISNALFELPHDDYAQFFDATIGGAACAAI